MINFLSACQDYSFLSAVLFIKRLLEFICVLVPIALIIMSAVEVSKIVLNPDAKVTKGVISRVTHKTVCSVAVFFLPILINLLLSMVGQSDMTSTACWTNANTGTINALKSAKEAEEEATQEEIAAERASAEQERQTYEALREAAREENAEKAAEAAKKASSNSSGTATEKAARLIQIAQAQADKHPSDSPNEYTRGYGPISGYGSSVYDYPWCAAFVWWCSNEAGVYPAEVNYKTAGVTSYIGYFRNNSDGNRYEPSAAHGGTYVPKMGDYIFFSNEHIQYDGDHIGLVKGVSGDRVLIIDGNCSNTVCDRSLYLTDGYIIGYGVWE